MEPTAESNRSFRLQEEDINVLCMLPMANPRVRARAGPRLMGRRGQTYIWCCVCCLGPALGLELGLAPGWWGGEQEHTW